VVKPSSFLSHSCTLIFTTHLLYCRITCWSSNVSERTEFLSVTRFAFPPTLRTYFSSLWDFVSLIPRLVKLLLSNPSYCYLIAPVRQQAKDGGTVAKTITRSFCVCLRTLRFYNGFFLYLLSSDYIIAISPRCWEVYFIIQKFICLYFVNSIFRMYLVYSSVCSLHHHLFEWWSELLP